MKIIRIVLFGVFGFLLGFGYLSLSKLGYFKRWEELPSPPTYTSEYFSGTVPRDSFPTEITKPCDYSKPEFSILSNSPKNMADCVQVKTIYADGHSRKTLVRDNNGNIWEWSYVSSPYGLIGLVWLPVYGLIIGLVFAIATKDPIQIQRSNS